MDDDFLTQLSYFREGVIITSIIGTLIKIVLILIYIIKTSQPSGKLKLDYFLLFWQGISELISQIGASLIFREAELKSNFLCKAQGIICQSSQFVSLTMYAIMSWTILQIFLKRLGLHNKVKQLTIIAYFLGLYQLWPMYDYQPSGWRQVDSEKVYYYYCGYSQDDSTQSFLTYMFGIVAPTLILSTFNFIVLLRIMFINKKMKLVINSLGINRKVKKAMRLIYFPCISIFFWLLTFFIRISDQLLDTEQGSFKTQFEFYFHTFGNFLFDFQPLINTLTFFIVYRDSLKLIGTNRSESSESEERNNKVRPLRLGSIND